MPAGDAPPNAVARMLGVLGDEWTLLLVQRALLGARRYGDFLAELPISNAVLSHRLKLLTDHGLFEARVYQTGPPRSEYLTTPRSRSLWPMLTAVWDWERRRVAGQADTLPLLRHTLCGNVFHVELRCAACGEPITDTDLAVRWGPSGSWERSIPASTHRRRSGTRRGGASHLFPQTMSVIGDRWGFAMLVAAFVGVDRFSEFQRHLGAPPGTVADRLDVLGGEEILTGSDGAYRLTAKGRELLPVLLTALAWAERWFADPAGPAVVVTHVGCGHRVQARLHCDRCSGRLRGAHVLPVSAAGHNEGRDDAAEPPELGPARGRRPERRGRRRTPP